MTEPTNPKNKPTVMELEAGVYFWCSCGKSANAPFCDGAHKGTGKAPVKFELDETKKVALCNCQHTGAIPMCDGAHSKL